eukprot:TRINITY_DN4009_c0_g1_i1.p1 TRINITY_DN4009_c0_g1~~TRINITY_DN4009_c0_g1_i1.p1  ORF type:complete len:393 (+),score=72.25 TRINITY_DN4009_c0_g1_i1:138-1181(+)
MTGSVLCCVTYVLFKHQRTKAGVLLAILSACDFGQGLFFCVVGPPEGASCSFMSVWGIWFADTTFFWTACISLFCFCNVTEQGRRIREGAQYVSRRFVFKVLIVAFHVVSWGYPTAICVALLSAQKTEHDPEGFWCFIPSDEPTWRLFALMLPLIVCWIVTLVTCIGSNIQLLRVKHHLNQLEKIQRLVTHKKRQQDTLLWQVRLTSIPIIFFLFRIWDVIYRLAEAGCTFNNKSVPSFFSSGWYTVLVIVGDATQGITNAIVFVVLEPEVRLQWMGFVKHIYHYVKAPRGIRPRLLAPIISKHKTAQPVEVPVTPEVESEGEDYVAATSSMATATSPDESSAETAL